MPMASANGISQWLQPDPTWIRARSRQKGRSDLQGGGSILREVLILAACFCCMDRCMQQRVDSPSRLTWPENTRSACIPILPHGLVETSWLELYLFGWLAVSQVFAAVVLMLIFWHRDNVYLFWFSLRFTIEPRSLNCCSNANCSTVETAS